MKNRVNDKKPEVAPVPREAKHVAVPVELFTASVKILQQQPYSEVADVMQALLRCQGVHIQEAGHADA